MTRTQLRLVLVCACIAVFLFAGCMAAVQIATGGQP